MGTVEKQIYRLNLERVRGYNPQPIWNDNFFLTEIKFCSCRRERERRSSFK
jgi:hypothetical protein